MSLDLISVIKVTLLFIIFIIGTTSDGLLLYAFFTSNRSHLSKGVYRLILSLSCAGLIALLTLPFQIATTLNQSWPGGTFTCKLVEFMEHVSLGVITLTHAMISLDRFFAVVRAQSGPLSSRCVKALLISSWLLSAALFSVDFYLYQAVVEGARITCTSVQFNSEAINIVFRTAKIIFFVVPFMVICLCNAMVMRVVWFKWQRQVSHEQSRASRQQSRVAQAKIRLTKMTIALAIVFIFGGSPKFFISQLKGLYSHSLSVPYQVSIFALFITSALIPVIIFVYDKNFSSFLLKLFCRNTLQERQAESSVYNSTLTRVNVESNPSTTQATNCNNGENIEIETNQ